MVAISVHLAHHDWDLSNVLFVSHFEVDLVWTRLQTVNEAPINTAESWKARPTLTGQFPFRTG